MIDFEVERIDYVALDGPDELLSQQLMSPFVWTEPDDARCHMLVRAVPPNMDAQKRIAGISGTAVAGATGCRSR
ncbi:MAG: hypothetical protein OSB00_18830 [Sphingomonas bacterium]|nr:hypothetical protein [Sphingomonas bacterium]